MQLPRGENDRQEKIVIFLPRMVRVFRFAFARHIGGGGGAVVPVGDVKHGPGVKNFAHGGYVFVVVHDPQRVAYAVRRCKIIRGGFLRNFLHQFIHGLLVRIGQKHGARGGV